MNVEVCTEVCFSTAMGKVGSAVLGFHAFSFQFLRLIFIDIKLKRRKRCNFKIGTIALAVVGSRMNKMVLFLNDLRI